MWLPARDAVFVHTEELFEDYLVKLGDVELLFAFRLGR